MKNIKTFEDFQYYHEGDIDNIKVGQTVKYNGIECEVIENTGERIDLLPIDGTEKIEVLHYNASDIKTEW